MAFIDCAVFAEPAVVTIDDNADAIRVRCGNYAQLGLSIPEAVQLRDDLSRAIVEAAQASAKAVKVEGETA